MKCTSPIKGYYKYGGGFTTDVKFSNLKQLTITCGRCYGCRERKACDWATRCVHESQMHETNSFITLTYNDEHLPKDGSLKIEHFQKFMKRFRKSIQPHKIRFLHCGEYGKVYTSQGDSRYSRERLPHPFQDDREALGRPHYHALIFGWDFPDKTIHKIDRGNKIYTSKELESLWPFGFNTIGSVTHQSAKYVAGYIQKKINGDLAEDYYKKLDLTTGETHTIVPEYITMSRRPGIASTWYEKYRGDIFPHDECVIAGKKFPVPRYYTEKLKKEMKNLAEDIRQQRRSNAKLNKSDNTPERLAVKAKINNLKNDQHKRENIQ